MSMLKKTITLPQTLEDWINAQTASGRFSSDSEYIRDLIRRDQERQDAAEQLRGLIEEARASGESKRSVEEIFSQAIGRGPKGDA